MKYQLFIAKTAEKELNNIHKSIYQQIVNKIVSLEENPRPYGVKKLLAKEEYRIRVGDHRVLYVVDDSRRIIKIIAVGHRREVYR